MSDRTTWSMACPACRAPLGYLTSLSDQFDCASCTNVYPVTNGILRFLPRDRVDALAQFLDDYTRIRRAEGRGSHDPSYYLNLPECPSDHPIAWQWAIRRRTFATLCSRVLPRLGKNLRTIDLGAGVGWLSYRLASLGHHPCAVELSLDDVDGLGAARHYAPTWPLIQAEFDRLPFADAVADVAIFNASLHYSTDYRVTLREARRVLRPGGSIIVLETPIYNRDESGRRMAAERHADFEKRFGTASNALPSIEYLTWGMIDELGRDLGIKWETYKSWYGLKWAMRPVIASLKGKREPSRFAVLVGKKAK